MNYFKTASIVFVMIMATVNQSMAGNALTQRQLYLATHIAVENTKPGSDPNEWLEPESDEEYNKL